MKITDLKEGQNVFHPRKGNGKVLKLKSRTIVIEYDSCVTTSVLKRKDVNFIINDL